MPKLSFIVLFAILLIWPQAALSQTAIDPELLRLRDNYAMRYLEPGSHMELAKYFREKGNSIQAFYILENARRYRFEQKVFDAAFLLHFGGFTPLDNSKAEEEKYLKLRKASPDDIKVIIHLADIYVSRDDFARAEPLLKLALEKDPQNYVPVGALAEIYSRQETPEKATKILADFETKYPNAADSYDMRIERVIDQDPAKAKELLTEAVKKYPDKGIFWFYLAVLADREKKIIEAEQHFLKAAELGKNTSVIQGYTAAFFRTEKRDNQTALKYYLNTYFLDPHAHFDGFAEAKVSNLNLDLSKAFVERSIAIGKKAEELLADPNPMVVSVALSMIANNWETSKTELFVKMLSHDDVLVRWRAMETLTEKEGRKLDSRIKELLLDSDMRVRGLAAYMAVKLWKDESFPAIRKMLSEEAQILRFDAISALIINGGTEGRKIVDDHKAKEKNASLRQMIESSTKATEQEK